MASGTVHELRDRLLERASRQQRVSIGDIAEEMNSRGRGPFFLIPALVELTPIGSIPGVPTIIALILGSFAIQVLFGREEMWLPGFIRNLSMSSGKMESSLQKLDRVVDWMDRTFHDRWSLFVSEPFQRAAAALVLLLCCSVPLLEFIPFASSVPMLTIAALGLAMLVHDGRVMVAACVTLFVSAAIVGRIWLGR